MSSIYWPETQTAAYFLNTAQEPDIISPRTVIMRWQTDNFKAEDGVFGTVQAHDVTVHIVIIPYIAISEAW